MENMTNNRVTKADADRRWTAVTRRDPSADGTFVYAVKTTGIYCRPSCAARRAQRENVEFHETPSDAERAGFRPCKRCRPDEPNASGKQIPAITRACKLIEQSESAPDLKSLADAVEMSPSHLHRLFKLQVGVSPKAYATSVRSQRVRESLAQRRTVTNAIYASGFNSSSRFYANATRLLGMKPKSYQTGGKGARILFAIGDCALGNILVAASQLGICMIGLHDDPKVLIGELHDRFPNAEIIEGNHDFDVLVARVVKYVERPSNGPDLPLDIRGTAFQHRVWQKLTEIPFGETRTYAQIAKSLGKPKAVRAVGSACGANRIAVAIPCHRAVRSDGSLAGYRWGIERKAQLLKRERRRN